MTESDSPTPVPAPCGVPPFPPLRVRGTRSRLRRALRRHRHLPVTLLVLAAAALALARSPGPAPAAPAPAPAEAAAPVRLVSAPVRIADAEAVRLLRPGDRVDVVAASGDGSGGARVIARSARVARVPAADGDRPDGGALVVLAVPRATAAELAGAAVTSPLAVTLC
ncbi:hypothetical protein [Streptomyces termitum]|uniref:hypothetical protein n=1 Tax=Streptomyces termitum TaxID=67368 RepID=UPI0033B92499